MIRLLKSSPDAAPCRKACSEYSLGFMPVHSGKIDDELHAFSRLPEYRPGRFIMTDGTVTRYKNRFGNSYFTGHQSGITISLPGLHYYPYIIRWTFPQFSGQTRCISIHWRRLMVNNCWVGGSFAWCGCKRGEHIPSNFSTQHAY